LAEELVELDESLGELLKALSRQHDYALSDGAALIAA
jgi:hypothetical protein